MPSPDQEQAQRVESLEQWLTQPRGVAVRLRELRARAGLSGTDLAQVTGWAQSKVSRVENGKQLPTAADIDAWAEATRATGDDRAHLHRLREDAQVAHVTFRERMRSGQAAVQRDHTWLTERSHHIRYVDTVFVPGLLQIPEYARRVLDEMVRLGNTGTDDVDQAVAERMSRQRFLYDPRKRFDFLITEPVLRWRLCPPAVMRAQLDRLLSVVGLDRVTLGIIPFSAQLAWTPLDTFQVYTGEETVVTAENLVEESSYRGDRAVRYAGLADRLWSEAVTGDDARQLIGHAAHAVSPS